MRKGVTSSVVKKSNGGPGTSSKNWDLALRCELNQSSSIPQRLKVFKFKEVCIIICSIKCFLEV